MIKIRRGTTPQLKVVWRLTAHPFGTVGTQRKGDGQAALGGTYLVGLYGAAGGGRSGPRVRAVWLAVVL